MRFKAILEQEARKLYPISILIFVVGLLQIPGSYLLVHFALGLKTVWWTVLSILFGLLVCCLMTGLASIVEDIHDIKMHTAGYDMEFSEYEYEDEDLPEEEPEQAEN